MKGEPIQNDTIRTMSREELNKLLTEPDRPSMVTDLTGRRNGRIFVTKFLGMIRRHGHSSAVWEVQCQCGNAFPILGQNTLRTQSCGCLLPDLENVPVYQWPDLSEKLMQPRYPHLVQQIAGERFGHLTVMRLLGVLNIPNAKRAVWACRCDCGLEIPATRRELVDGKVASCGCGGVLAVK